MSSDPVIDATLVRRLIEAQFPHWRGLGVRAVEVDGWDNRTFRLGEELSVRLPSGPAYELQVRKEWRHLPTIAAAVRLPVPEVIALGQPGDGYPFEWTVRRWIEGVPVRDDPAVDRADLALSLAGFLRELWAVNTVDGPAAGAHSAGRGGPLAQWDREVAAALVRHGTQVDVDRATEVWEAARSSPHPGPGVWFHGDVAPGNLLSTAGRLSAVIDFGCAGIGDPACDLAIAWTFFGSAERALFREAVDVGDAMWRRGAGWALWKALITVQHRTEAATSRFTLEQLRVASAERIRHTRASATRS
jgi:aminoglycoside phosphotransferase (APT) family kinase protein